MLVRSLVLALVGFLGLQCCAEEQQGNFPLFKWAQDKSRIWITVHVAEVQNQHVEIKESSLTFQGVGGKDKKKYRLDLEFLHAIDTEKSKHKRRDKNFQFILHKQNPGSHWPHLLKTTKKLEEGNMRIDWTRWTVEDEESTQEELNNSKNDNNNNETPSTQEDQQQQQQQDQQKVEVAQQDSATQNVESGDQRKEELRTQKRQPSLLKRLNRTKQRWTKWLKRSLRRKPYQFAGVCALSFLHILFFCWCCCRKTVTVETAKPTVANVSRDVGGAKGKSGAVESKTQRDKKRL